MRRLFFLPIALLTCGVVAARGAAYAEALQRYEYRGVEMGAEFHLILYAPSQSKAWQAAQAALKRIQELDHKLSDYRENSELSRLCRRAYQRPVQASPELFHVLQQAAHYSRLSDGAFDVTIKPLVDLWRRARKTKQLPSPRAIDLAKQKIGFQNIELRPETRKVRLKIGGMRIDLGGIAKGYAADEALETLLQHGISHALIAAGGDLRFGDPPPGEKGWSVAIESMTGSSGDGNSHLVLSNAAVSTSGDKYQFVEIGGVRYSHIVDPATGLGLRERKMVTVIAPDGITADALATTFSVLPSRKALALADLPEGVSARIVVQEEEGISYFISKEFPLKH